jgi:hypothetical protein
MNQNAQELARLSKGKPKTLTKAERYRRKKRMAYARLCKHRYMISKITKDLNEESKPI